MSPFKHISVSPYCVSLRSKKLVFQTHPPRTDEEILDASGHTWCEESQEVVGPDGETCSPQDCQAGLRRCFRPYSKE